jgi:SAM-dependent methyltransferase
LSFARRADLLRSRVLGLARPTGSLGYASWLRLVARDAHDRLTRRRAPLTPPRRIQVQGGPGDFERVGHRWLALLIKYGAQPDSDVLDIGCGPGRIAVPLTSYLSEGSYEGFDVSSAAVRWCQRAVSPRFPRFNFRLVKVGNRRYNRTGPQPAVSFVFPYADGSFDTALAASVFTHMKPEEVARYLAETARVLRPGGRLLSTYFLLNEDRQRRHSARDEVPHSFVDESGRAFRASDAAMPEHKVALEEADVRDMHTAAGLSIRRVEYGRWAGSSTMGRRQDLIVAERREPHPRRRTSRSGPWDSPELASP